MLATPTVPNPWDFIGGGAFVTLSLTIGLMDVPFAQEIVFAAQWPPAALDAAVDPSDRPAQAQILIGIPDGVRVQGCSPTRPRTTWIVIGGLEFDTQFLAVLGLVASTLILAVYPDCHISMVLTLPNIAL